MFRRTLCLQEFGLELRVLSSDLKKEREEVIKGGRKGRGGERERERESESYHTPLSQQGQSFCAISLEHETSSVGYESTVSRKEVSSFP